MTQAANIAAIRAVELAAANLTLACTEMVGPLPMAIAMPTAHLLGEGIPARLQRDVDIIENREERR